MDRKAQVGIGAIILAAVAILIGLAFYTTSLSQNIGQMTKTFNSNNVTMTLPVNMSTSELSMCGQKAISLIATNATGGEVILATNYTISQSPGTDGYLAAKITYTGGGYSSRNANISCNYEPKGYLSDGGSRGIVALIGVFMALLIVVAAIPDLRNGVIDFVKGK